ncbi:vitamin K epoxide reductase family protein [Aquimarina sp. 2-A2]|uniref:vitamin K epoxide reductase family protein n=1 Tax=Aquimarina sp. 2-A2 TaxID=3382644 RepID=UPI00387F1726
MQIKNIVVESILKYFERERISINTALFKFRLITHPGYPNLLSIIETLDYFHIHYDVYNVNFQEIDQTPERYLAFLKTIHGRQDLHLVEKKDEEIYIDSKKVSLHFLEVRWKGIVLILNQAKDKKIRNKSAGNIRRNSLCGLTLVCALAFVLSQTNVSNSLFSLLSIFGFAASILSLEELFKLKTNPLDKFCSQSRQYDCESIINSKKWKLFNYVSFSDLSFLFFLSQIVSYSIMTLAGQESAYFFYQTIALGASIPFVLISLYYQRFVEKKWCPICLTLSGILSTQLCLLVLFIEPSTSMNLESLLLFTFIQMIIIGGWFGVKNILTQLHTLKENKITDTRLLRNYSLFRYTIKGQKRHDLNTNQLITKPNNNQQLIVTLITNPFCEHCKKAHASIKEIQARYNDRIALQTILNVDILDESDNDKLICQNMMAMQLNGENKKFAAALDDWFTYENESKWLTTYAGEFDEQVIEKKFINQKNWCIQNQIDFTPGLFINGYFYPKIYAIEHLDYFIQDLLSDTEILATNDKLTTC